tara:strand:+ start:79 stop:837 length:759 start_codon:yes stop_codon:yes gene_type:complete
MLSVEVVVYGALVYTLAGFVKGVVGLGLPTISLALLVPFFGLKEAMAILIVPSLITNVVQALTGGRLFGLIQRLWVFLLALCTLTWFSTGILVIADSNVLTMGLGVILLLYCFSWFLKFKIPTPGANERWLNPIMGGLTGVSTGLTGTFVVPGILYLQSMMLDRHSLVQAMGLCFSMATISLGVSLGGRGILDYGLVFISSAMVIPALIGMWLGARVRSIINEALFRKLFFLSLFAIGVWIIVNALIKLGLI